MAEWSVEQKRQIVEKLARDLGVAQACRLVGLRRSTYYRGKRKKEDAQLEAIVRQLAGKHPWYGYRRIGVLVRKKPGYKKLGDKRIRRIMARLGLLIKRKKKPRRTTNSQHEHPRYPNLVMDLKIDHPKPDKPEEQPYGDQVDSPYG